MVSDNTDKNHNDIDSDWEIRQKNMRQYGHTAEIYGDLRLYWSMVPEIKSCGHGYEFYYDDKDIIAFIPRYGRYGVVDIITLLPDSKIWAKIGRDPVSIFKDLRRSIYLRLKTPQSDGKLVGNISVHING